MSSYEEYLETHGGRKPHGCLRIFGRVFLVLTLGLIAFMIGFVIFRSYEQEPHGDLARFMWTERTAAVASADGTAAALSIEPQVNYTPDKYFLVYNVVRVPESGELQLTVAYNLNRLGRAARTARYIYPRTSCRLYSYSTTATEISMTNSIICFR